MNLVDARVRAFANSGPGDGRQFPVRCRLIAESETAGCPCSSSRTDSVITQLIGTVRIGTLLFFVINRRTVTRCAYGTFRKVSLTGKV